MTDNARDWNMRVFEVTVCVWGESKAEIDDKVRRILDVASDANMEYAGDDPARHSTVWRLEELPYESHV
jgi:hypothetical protein